MVIRLGKKRNKKRDNLPPVLPWEQREPSHHHSFKVGIALLLILSFGIVLGYNAGLTHDPTTTTTNTHDHGSNGDSGSSGSSNANKTILTAPSNTSGIVLLPSYWIVSGQSLLIQFSILFSTSLQPTWTDGSGWVTTYWLLLPPQTFNVTLPFCQPLRQISVAFNPDNSISWTVIGKAIVTPIAPRDSFSFECGIL